MGTHLPYRPPLDVLKSLAPDLDIIGEIGDALLARIAHEHARDACRDLVDTGSSR